MEKEKAILFEGRKIRRVWYKNEWWFAITDIISILINNKRSRKYWNDLKKKLYEEGYVEVSENIGQLKMQAPDGKGIKLNLEFAILTNEIMQAAFDLRVEDYKKLKGLKRQNLRDHMSDIELILTMLGETTTTKITTDRDSKGFQKLKKDAKEGGSIAGRTRRDIEQTTGKKVISTKNYLIEK